MNSTPSNWPLLSPSSSFLIRAPLTSDDLSSGSEIELDSGSDSASEISEVEPEPLFKPVARLTGDDDVIDSGEESFDEVDGDGFVVRVRIPNPDLNPGFNEYVADNASENEVGLDVDGDGLLSATVVNSSFDPGNNVNVLTSSSEESFETVDGDGFPVRAKRYPDLDDGLVQDGNLGEHVGVKDASLNNLVSSQNDLLGQNDNGESLEESEVDGLSSQKPGIVLDVEVPESGKMNNNSNLENIELGQCNNLGDTLYGNEKTNDTINEAYMDENVSVQDSNDLDHSLHSEDDFVAQKSHDDSPNAIFNAKYLFANYDDMEFSMVNSSSGENYSAEEYLGDGEADGFVVDSTSSHTRDRRIYSDTNNVGTVGQNDPNGSYKNSQESDDLLRQNDSGESFEESEVDGHSSQKPYNFLNVEVPESGKMHDNSDLENIELGQCNNLDDNLYGNEKTSNTINEVYLDENVSVQDSNDLDHSLHLEDDFVGEKSHNDCPNASFNAKYLFRNYDNAEFSMVNSSSIENYSAEEYLGDGEADCFVVDSASSQSRDRRIYSGMNNVGNVGQNHPNGSYENTQESDDSDAEMIIKDRFSSASTVYDVLDNDDSLCTSVQNLSLNGSVEIEGSSVNSNEIIKDSIEDEGSGIGALDEKADIFSGGLKGRIFVANEDLKAKNLEPEYHIIADTGYDENIIDKEVETGAVYVQEFGNSIICDKMNINSEAKSQAVEFHKDGIEEACNHKDMDAASIEEIENDIAGSYQKYEPVHGNGSISLIAEENSATEAVSNQKSEPDKDFADIPNLTVPEVDNSLVEKVEALKVKFLRVIYKLGFSPQDTIPASVFHRLSLIVGTKYSVNAIERIREKAIDLENEENDNLNFSCNILIIGKAGVGKSATLNSVFEDEKSPTNVFGTATSSVRIIEGFIDGVRIRILDTPGLGHYLMDQTSNIKILSSVKVHMKKYPIDAVLYVDRLDVHSILSNDLPLFKSITDTLGQSIWKNAIITLTHAGEAPPDDSNGMPLSYEEYTNRRSCIIQLLIRQMVDDISSLKPVVLVENDSSCRMNIVGQNVHLNVPEWKPELLLLCCTAKILSEANVLKFNLLNPKNNSPQTSLQKILRSFLTPLGFLSLTLQSKNLPKPVSDGESEKDEYDHLPNFRPLTKYQIPKLSKEHKKAYFEEYDCHDYGFDGVSMQYFVTTAKKFPAEVILRVRKDKKIFSINLDMSICAKHGKCGSSLASFNLKTTRDEVAYILKTEAKFNNLKNKMNASVEMSSNMQGQIVVKLCESEQLGLVHFLGFASVAFALFRKAWYRE